MRDSKGELAARNMDDQTLAEEALTIARQTARRAPETCGVNFCGLAGIGRTLIAATTETEPAWDRMLLVSMPPADRFG